jgi:hypothetical protein
MGMFDYIVGVPEVLCDCGHKLENWQSKDHYCQLNKIHYTRVRNFYTYCKNCGLWVEFTTDRNDISEEDFTSPQVNAPKFSDYQCFKRKGVKLTPFFPWQINEDL